MKLKQIKKLLSKKNIVFGVLLVGLLILFLKNEFGFAIIVLVLLFACAYRLKEFDIIHIIKMKFK